MMDGSIGQQFEEEFKDFDKEFQQDGEAHKKSSDKNKKSRANVCPTLA